MPPITRFQPGCPCGCGSKPDEGCVFCGPFCSACGGIHAFPSGTMDIRPGALRHKVQTYGKFEDDQGEWGIDWAGVFGESVGDTFYGVPEFKHFPYFYSYEIGCVDSSTLGLNLYAAVEYSLEGCPLYRIGTPPWYPYGSLIATVTATPTCQNPITATFTIPSPVLTGPGGICPLYPPSKTVKVSIDIESFPTRKHCCAPCGIPTVDLKLRWVGGVNGGRTIKLPYKNKTWATTQCVDQLLFFLKCSDNKTNFGVNYFVNNDCPDGQSKTCQSVGDNPPGLVLADYTCKPFHLHYTVSKSACRAIADKGITDFYIDGPEDETDLGCDECGIKTCCNHKWPYSIDLTDSIGTHRLTHVPNSSPPEWALKFALSGTYTGKKCRVSDCTQIETDITVYVQYIATIQNNGSNCRIIIKRKWNAWAIYLPGLGTWEWEYAEYEDLVCLDSNCWTDIVTDQMIGHIDLDPQNCYPLNAVAPMSYPLGLHRSDDPIGGDVTISITDSDGLTKAQVCCSPCPIPKKDLTLSWNLSSWPGTWTKGANGSSTLKYNIVSSEWATDCLAADHSPGDRFAMLCNSVNGVVLARRSFCEEQCASPCGVNYAMLKDYTCDPYHFHFIDPNGFTGNFYIDE